MPYPAWVPLQARGQQTRTLQGNGGESVTLRAYLWSLPEVWGEFFSPSMKN